MLHPVLKVKDQRMYLICPTHSIIINQQQFLLPVPVAAQSKA